jgi:hypothetical protein
MGAGSNPERQSLISVLETVSAAVSEKLVEQLQDDSFEILLSLLKGSVKISDDVLAISICRDIESDAC